MLISLSFGKCWDCFISACFAVPRREEASNAEALPQNKRMRPNEAGCLQATEIIVVCRHWPSRHGPVCTATFELLPVRTILHCLRNETMRLLLSEIQDN